MTKATSTAPALAPAPGARAELSQLTDDELLVRFRALPRDSGERAIACEILVNTPGVRSMIASGNLNQLPSIMQQGRVDGMNLLSNDLLRLVRENKISLQQARMASYDDNI